MEWRRILRDRRWWWRQLIQVAVFTAVSGVAGLIHPSGGDLYSVLVVVPASIIGAGAANAIVPRKVVELPEPTVAS